jgi:hypothetical protein
MFIPQLFGDSYGFGNSMEHDTDSGGCILCLHKMFTSSTKNTVGHHRRRFGMCSFN